jgi:predicted benzoate:H+ symporter BenE
VDHPVWRVGKDAESVSMFVCKFSVSVVTCNLQSVANLSDSNLMSEYLRANLVLEVVTLKLCHIFKKIKLCISLFWSTK